MALSVTARVWEIDVGVHPLYQYTASGHPGSLPPRSPTALIDGVRRENTPSRPPAERSRALVAALQWGLVQAFALDAVARLLRNYYRATTELFFTPGWVVTLQFAAPLGLFVGGVGGYRWARSGRAASSTAAHRTRLRFVGALLVGWALAIVPTAAFGWLLGDLYSTPYFLLPTATAVAVLLAASLFAYRVDPAWYRRRRGRLLGAV